MTREQFDAWAYLRIKAFLDETSPSVVERPGFARVKIFVAALEGDRQVLAPDNDADPN